VLEEAGVLETGELQAEGGTAAGGWGLELDSERGKGVKGFRGGFGVGGAGKWELFDRG
jgi:hypothetical protein